MEAIKSGDVRKLLRGKLVTQTKMVERLHDVPKVSWRKMDYI